MAKRYFNWKLAIVLVIGLCVLGITAYGLRQWQRTGRAEQALKDGLKAYQQQRWDEAAEHLGRYLAIERDDVPILLKYADAQLKKRPASQKSLQQAIAAYRTALRIDSSHYEAAMQLIEIYLSVGMPGEAELIATRQLQINKDPKLRRMLALAMAGQRRFNEAAAELKAIIKEHPEQIPAYETLGRLTEQRPQDFPDPAVHWYDEAVRNNPTAALAYIIRANFYLRRNDRTKALTDLQQADKQDLSDPAVRLRLAGEFINAGLLDTAEKHLIAVQEQEPTNEGLWRTWALLAFKSRSQEKMLKVAQTGLKEFSSQPWDFMPIAVELFITCNEYDRAADCLNKLKQKDIALDRVAFLEGLLADKKGNTYEAVKFWRRSIELGNNSPQVRLALASAYSRLGDRQSALWQLRTLVSKMPDSFDGHLALARLLAAMGNWAQAEEHAANAILLSPQNLDAHLLHLQARMQLLAASSTTASTPEWQDIEKQLYDLDKQTDGNNVEVKLLQLQMAMQQGDFTNAEQLINQLKNTEVSRVRISLVEAELLAVQEKIDEAISLLDKTIEKFPQAPEPVKYQVILLARQNDYQRCETVIKEALARIKPVGAGTARRELGLLLAQTYRQWKQKDKEYEFLNRLAQQLPNDIPVKRLLLACEPIMKNPVQAQRLIDDIKVLEGQDGWQWRYEQARAWFGSENFKERYPQIISLLQENLLSNPDDQTSRMLLAATYERAGELQLAITTYREALDRSPDNLNVIIPVVAVLYKAKEYDQADEILSRASQQRPSHPQLEKLKFQSYLRRGELGPASNILQDVLSTDPNNQAALFSLALLKMQQNEFAEAEQYLASLKANDPNSLPITYAQIQLNIRQNRPQEALRLCDEVINSYNNASAYILRARTYATLGQNSKAREDLEHACAIEPNNVEVWVAKSEFYRSMARLGKAIADIQRALSLDENDIQVQKRAISLFLTEGSALRVQQARAILNKALKTTPEDIELRLLKARVLMAEGTTPAIESAVDILQKITEEQPENIEAWVLRGEIALRRGQPAETIDAALRGLVHRPNDRTLLMLKARAEAARSAALAIPTLNLLRELEPNDVDIAIYSASIYTEAGEPARAVNLLKTQLSKSYGPADERRINIAMAAALHRNGNKTEAYKLLDSLLQSDPNDPNPLLIQAGLLKDDQSWDQIKQKVTNWCRTHSQDTHLPVTVARELAAVEKSRAQKTAEDILRMVLNQNANCAEAMSALAMLLQITDRSEEAAVYYQRLLELQPDNVIAINNLAWILCEEQGKFQQALQLTEKGLKISPNYVDLIDTRGVTYYRLGEFNRAVQDFTKCIELYPSTAPAAVATRFHLARAFARLGEKDKAVEQLNRALDLESKIGGLSASDLAEAQRLLEQLQKGS